MLSETGVIAFYDIDLVDVHTTSVAPAPSNTLGGTLAMGTPGESAEEAGTVAWTYQVANSAVQYLAAGEIVQERFTVTISDGKGGTVAQVVTVTITGTNGAPVIDGTLFTGAVTELGSNIDTGTIGTGGSFTFDDTDLADFCDSWSSNDS